MEFDKMVEWILNWEDPKWKSGGTITNDPDDPGGVTKYGISQRFNPGVDVRNLDLEGAKGLYRSRYFDTLRFSMDNPPDSLYMAAFDSAVNMGVGRVNLWLETCDNYQDLINIRKTAYQNIVNKYPKRRKFLKGWLARCEALEQFCATV